MVRFVFTFIITTFAGLAVAQPEIIQVSGPLENGSIVQVSGSGFGEKLNAEPSLWDDLSSPAYGGLSDGSPIPTKAGTNGHLPDSQAPHVTADGPSCEGSTVIREPGRVPGRPVYALSNSSGWLGGFDLPGAASLYLDWWMFVPYGTDNTGQTATLNRILRLQQGQEASTGDIKLYENHVSFAKGPGADDAELSYSNLFPAEGGWTHLAVWTDASGGINNGGLNQGVLKVWRDGQLIHSSEELNGEGQGFTTINSLGLQVLPGGEPGDEYQLGDIYADESLARVMLGNAERWENVTHYEMQIPRGWLITNISFNVNQGSYSEGDQAYLYVSDPQGNINEYGYLLEVGPTGPGQPGTPTIDP